MATMGNTAFLLRTWGVSLVVIGFSLFVVAKSLGDGDHGEAYVVVGSLVFVFGMVWFLRRRAQRAFVRDFLAPGPEALIERSQRALGGARIPHARESLALGVATSRAFYGQFGRARDELAEIGWDALPPLYRGSALQVRALIHYLSGDDPAAGLRCALEALELTRVPRFVPGAQAGARIAATYVEIGRMLVDGATPELAAALSARVAATATPQERLLTTWGAAVAHQQLNQSAQAQALFAQLRAAAPNCTPLHALPVRRAAGAEQAGAASGASEPPGACARHPEVAAAARCVRCGDFACEPCRRPISRDASICLPCRDRYASLREEHRRAESRLRSAGALAQGGAMLFALAALVLPTWSLFDARLEPMRGLALLLVFWTFIFALGGRSLRRLEVGFRARSGMLVAPLIMLVPVGWLAGGYLLWLAYGPSGRTIQSLEYQRAIAATPELASGPSRTFVAVVALALLANVALFAIPTIVLLPE